MGTVDLCRVVGILLDNAVEAIEGTKGVVRVMVSAGEQGTSIMVANKVTAPLDLSAIFQKGFTTKDGRERPALLGADWPQGKRAKRGLGLYSLRVILGRYPNAAITAENENGEAVFRLEVGLC
jgi:two-component system sensor histidine kinase AgrC